MAKVALKYGILISLALFLWLCLEYVTGLYTEFMEYHHPVLTLAVIIIPFLFVYFGMRERKRAHINKYTYGKAFLTGLAISLVAAFTIPVAQWAFQELVFPDFFESMISYAESRALAQGVDAVMARQEAEEYFSFWNYLMQSVVSVFIAGIIASAILAIFMRDSFSKAA